MPRVSVIIPYTDRDKDLLQRSRGSVDNQTHPPYEVIPVYDAEYRGIPWARNTGFERSTGDLILPLDCDDWIEPNYLERTLPYIEDPKVGIVSTGMIYHGEKDGLYTPAKPQTYASELQSNQITVTSLVRRRAIELAGPWDHNLRGWEDWDMWLRILKLGYKHVAVNEPLFHYRLHNSGMNAWANQRENKQRLYGYLLSKHPGFGVIRQDERQWNDI